MKKLFVLFLVLNLIPTAFALGKTYWGAKVAVGKGYARTYLRMDGKIPRAVGIALSESALKNLPHEMLEYTLPLPSGRRLHPYKHVTLDWNPHGHEPGGVYDRPHFDYHFYFISKKQRQSISCTGTDAAICTQMPESELIPTDYAPTPEGVPKMGWHGVDLTAPEFNGGIFTRTFIYGYYSGELIFLEPMVTRDYLLSKERSLNTIRRPQHFPYQMGNYPAQYKVYFDRVNKLHRVELVKFNQQESL